MLDSRRNVALACALSALAGYVDGIGFLHLGGLFVSFMSGNSTRLGVSLAAGHWRDAAEAFGLIGLFVGGAAAGCLIVLGCRTNRQPWVLLAEALLLAVAALCYAFGQPQAVMGRAGGRFGGRRSGVSLDQSRRDLVRRGRGTGHERDRRRRIPIDACLTPVGGR
jgi:Protein of unknown function (DUF1275)